MTVRNRTSLPIDGMTFMLRFPETGSDTSYPIGYQYEWGATMLKRRNPLSSEDRSPGIPLNLLPQQTATVDLGAHYQEYSELLESRLATSAVTQVELSTIIVDFANGIEWGGGQYYRPSAGSQQPTVVDPSEVF